MFGRRIHLFTVLGFAVSLDPSWFVVAALVTFSLAQYFPRLYGGLPAAVYWAMGLAVALGLFASVVIHELSHSLVARRHGLQMRGITLFIFGGVAEMTGEPADPKTELLMAIAGPAASLGLALLLAGVGRLGRLVWPVPVAGVLGYLAAMNLALGVFNLVPAFPLDGGRVLRAVLWQWKGSLRWATRITSRIGAGFGLLLMGLGLLRVLTGAWDGLWYLLIGMFVRNAARMSYQQLLLRRALEGEPVSRFMQTNPVTVPRSLSIAELVEGYIYRYHFKMFPVVDDAGRLLGCVTTRQVRELPREEWDRQTVGALAADGCGKDSTVGPETDAMGALSRMNGTGASRLLVVDGDRLLGILSLKDLLGFFALKMELEGAA
ncbi:MAG TPA: site-2 protease family protein [Thermoanaerobaculia bacterium]|nr:site-2 protease family protein [Thermoanaerobaculia bacterium]